MAGDIFAFRLMGHATHSFAGMVSLAAITAITAITGSSCTPSSSSDPSPAPPASSTPDPLAPLRAYEKARREGADFAHLPASDHALGPDPYALASLPRSAAKARFAGLLRGRDALVLLEEGLHEIARFKAPASPTGLAVSEEGDIFVSGEESPLVAHYRVEEGALTQIASIEIPGALALRDIALRPGPGSRLLYAVEEHDGRLFVVTLPPTAEKPPSSIRVCNGPFRVEALSHWLITGCILDRSLVAYALDKEGMPLSESAVTIRHDGPFWGFSALESDGKLILAAGGIEDHPLERKDGSFGYIDSFAYFYRIAPGDKSAEKLAEINTSAEGVVTPKAISLRAVEGGYSAVLSGYGSDRLLEITLHGDKPGAPSLSTRPFVPGTSAMARLEDGAFVFASPLFDAFVRLDPGGKPILVPASDPEAKPRSAESRLGEALIFTTLMAPWNKSDGRLSRFTCESCHFEGYVDGRTHHTGRGEVHATTKPLLGLFNNRPHFSRALDPDLSTVANNEFRVAGALSGHDPWFSLEVKERPWLRDLAGDTPLDPTSLRRAFMAFLMDFTPRPNPAVLGRSSFSAEEKRGAEIFAARCESCHAARLSSELPDSRVGTERWEALVFQREGPIVWGRSDYKKTGVEPYVHEKGARVPSLRRLFKKRPYFTNGSAPDLAELLSLVRYVEGKAPDEEGAFFHAFHDEAPPGAKALSDEERAALAAFLDLL